jgi:hypothetical protein
LITQIKEAVSKARHAVLDTASPQKMHADNERIAGQVRNDECGFLAFDTASTGF